MKTWKEVFGEDIIREGVLNDMSIKVMPHSLQKLCHKYRFNIKAVPIHKIQKIIAGYEYINKIMVDKRCWLLVRRNEIRSENRGMYNNMMETRIRNDEFEPEKYEEYFAFLGSIDFLTTE